MTPIHSALIEPRNPFGERLIEPDINAPLGYGHELLTQLGDDRPSILYHYTSAEGLQGILTSHQLWATEVQHLNDSSEGQYGLTICLEELDKAADALGGPAPRFVSDFRKHFSEARDTVYVACFCEDGDLVPQWRGYGAAGAGYAIGFRSDLLSLAADAPMLRVVYDEQRQRALASWVAHCMLDLIDRSVKTAKQDGLIPTRGAVALATLFLILAHCFKPSVFAYEREWRLMDFHPRGTGEREKDVRFRTIQGVLAPYRQLRIRLTPEEQIPVAEVVCGPTLQHSALESSVSWFLSVLDIEATVRRSIAPLRY